MFEEELAEYTGAPHVVCVDSCTNALFLSLLWCKHHYDTLTPRVTLPKHTYVGVAHAALNSGHKIHWHDGRWVGSYRIAPYYLVDSAKSLYRGMYHHGIVCISFQAAKILPIGRGGAILHDHAEADAWFRKARFDGRTEGDQCDTMTEFQQPGHHMYMTPPDAARGLWLLTYLPDNPPDQVDEYPDLSELF